jgi:hypothetical protein
MRQARALSNRTSGPAKLLRHLEATDQQQHHHHHHWAARLSAASRIRAGRPSQQVSHRSGSCTHKQTLVSGKLGRPLCVSQADSVRQAATGHHLHRFGAGLRSCEDSPRRGPWHRLHLAAAICAKHSIARSLTMSTLVRRQPTQPMALTSARADIGRPSSDDDDARRLRLFVCLLGAATRSARLLCPPNPLAESTQGVANNCAQSMIESAHMIRPFAIDLRAAKEDTSHLLVLPEARRRANCRDWPLLASLAWC